MRETCQGTPPKCCLSGDHGGPCVIDDEAARHCDCRQQVATLTAEMETLKARERGADTPGGADLLSPEEREHEAAPWDEHAPQSVEEDRVRRSKAAFRTGDRSRELVSYLNQIRVTGGAFSVLEDLLCEAPPVRVGSNLTAEERHWLEYARSKTRSELYRILIAIIDRLAPPPGGTHECMSESTPSVPEGWPTPEEIARVKLSLSTSRTVRETCDAAAWAVETRPKLEAASKLDPCRVPCEHKACVELAARRDFARAILGGTHE